MAIGTGEAILYLGIAFFNLILCFFFLALAIMIPWKNKKDNENHVIGINNLKWLKFASFFLFYLAFLFLVSYLYEISIAYLTITSLSNILNWLYLFLIATIWPLLITTIIIIFIQAIIDNKTQKALERGLESWR